jgi:hypothetical protein
MVMGVSRPASSLLLAEKKPELLGAIQKYYSKDVFLLISSLVSDHQGFFLKLSTVSSNNS